MIETIIEFFKQNFSPQMAVLLMSMTPVIEMSGAIPVGIMGLNLPVLDVLIISIIGNMIPNFFILKFLDPVVKLISKHWMWFDKTSQKLFHYTQNKHSIRFNAIGSIFLILFVALPGPGSGTWSGSLIAYLFKVPYFKALGLLFIGLIIGAVTVTALSVGTDTLIQIFSQ